MDDPGGSASRGASKKSKTAADAANPFDPMNLLGKYKQNGSVLLV